MLVYKVSDSEHCFRSAFLNRTTVETQLPISSFSFVTLKSHHQGKPSYQVMADSEYRRSSSISAHVLPIIDFASFDLNTRTSHTDIRWTAIPYKACCCRNLHTTMESRGCDCSNYFSDFVFICVIGTMCRSYFVKKNSQTW